jgi:hypothetical protein
MAAPRAVDHTGKRFGRLVVRRRVPAPGRPHPLWLCRCDCGNEKIVAAQNLVTKTTQSCGCLLAEYGRSYAIMMRDPSQVCRRWREGGIECFMADIEPRPSKKHYLVRRSNRKQFSRSNCCWELRSSVINTRLRFLTLADQTKTVSQWAREIGVRKQTLFARMHKGWSDEKVLTTRIDNKGKWPLAC